MTVGARSQPFRVASGDYYDVLELLPHRFLFALGDVMGHGAPTAPTLAMVRSQLHEWSGPETNPGDLLRRIHGHLRRHGHPNVFMTLSVLILDTAAATAEVAVAGPPAPLLCRDGRAACVIEQPGWTLGYPFDETEFQTETLSLVAGDSILFYSDGLSDAACGPDPSRDALGTAGLQKMFCEVCAGRAEHIVAALFAAVDRYRGEWPAEDDASALVVTFAGPPA